MERRDFIRVCAASAIAFHGAPVPAASDVRPRGYARTLLTDDGGRPLRASQLSVGENYVFHYPFEGTPCFLLNLGKPTGRNVPLKTGTGADYQWPGGWVHGRRSSPIRRSAHTS